MSLNQPEPNNPFSGSSNFSPDISTGRASLAEVLQIYCQSDKSGQLSFSRDSLIGYIYLQHGQIIHANAQGLEGEEAVYLLLYWAEGIFAFDETILPHKRSVDSTIEQLLIMGAQWSDEVHRGRRDIPQGNTSVNYSAGMSKDSALVTSRTQGGQPRLTIISNNQSGKTIDLDKQHISLGRLDENDICLPDPSVSGRHAMFLKNGQDILIRDLNSSNGTYVNNEAVTEAILQLGDLIQIGDVWFRFESSVRRPKISLREGVSTAPIKTTAPLPRVNAALISKKTSGPSGNPNKAISYKDLATPAPLASKGRQVGVIFISVLVVIGLLAAAYFFILKK